MMKRRRFLFMSSVAGVAGTAALSPRLNASLSSISTVITRPPYVWNALEPFINSTLLREHFNAHHQPHIAQLDSQLVPKGDIVDCVASRPNWFHRSLLNLRTATHHNGGARMLAARLCQVRNLVRKHGGGHVNHSLFWRWMAPPGSSPDTPAKAFGSVLEASFGSFIDFQSIFTRAALSVEGDGWAWLVVRADRSLAIVTTSGEDNPLMRSIIPDDQLGIPILGIDMAPHAYASQYSDNRQGYIEAWWKVVNWPQVAADYSAFDKHSHLLLPPAHDPLWGSVEHAPKVNSGPPRTFRGLLKPEPPCQLTLQQALDQNRLRQAQRVAYNNGSGSHPRPAI